MKIPLYRCLTIIYVCSLLTNFTGLQKSILHLFIRPYTSVVLKLLGPQILPVVRSQRALKLLMFSF